MFSEAGQTVSVHSFLAAFLLQWVLLPVVTHLTITCYEPVMKIASCHKTGGYPQGTELYKPDNHSALNGQLSGGDVSDTQKDVDALLRFRYGTPSFCTRKDVSSRAKKQTKASKTRGQAWKAVDSCL